MENPKLASTEPIWQNQKTEIKRISFLFQTVETVNKPRLEKQRISDQYRILSQIYLIRNNHLLLPFGIIRRIDNE